MSLTKEDISRIIEEEDVKFIRMQFVDVLGQLKNVAITASQLPRALDGMVSIDGHSIEGFNSVNASDQYLVPDLDTFCIYPYACDGCAAQRIRVRVRGVAEALCPLEAPGREVKPLYVAPNNETVFELMTEPGEFAFYAIRWAENREGTALQADWGSAPHEFEEA